MAAILNYWMRPLLMRPEKPYRKKKIGVIGKYRKKNIVL
jgi:hypothetical protein